MLQEVIPSQCVFFLKFSSRQGKAYLLLHISEIWILFSITLTSIFKQLWCYNKVLTQQHALHTNGYISYAGSLLPIGTESSSKKAMQIIAFAVGPYNRTSQKWIRKTKLFFSAFTKLSACYLNFISGTADIQVTVACQRIQDGGQRTFLLTDSLAWMCPSHLVFE